VPDNIAALALTVKGLVEEIDELKPGELGGQKVVNDLISYKRRCWTLLVREVSHD
jgi:hypothetical protein